MTSNFESWLARLADPAGPNANWQPRPFERSEFDALRCLIDTAGRHNVRPAVVANLNSEIRRSPDSVVAGDFEETRQAIEMATELRLQDVARAVLLDKTGREICAEIEARDLPAVLVKGTDFARRAYGGLHMRTFSDVDLLVDADAEADLAELLRERGFEEQPYKKWTETSERQWVRLDDHENAILVEIHTDMVHDPSLRRRQTLTHALYTDPSMGGITPASRLVLAALHGATSHLFGRLQYVVDGLMIGRMGIDAEEMKERASRSGAILPLATMLRLSAELFGCAISGELLRSLGSVPWSGLERRLITPEMVLAAKGTHRWRLLPQRHLYRRLLQ